MSLRTTPPFRADHVGSLLRPPELLKAREDFAEGRIDAEELRGIEDEAIRDVVRKQEEVGLQSATDGEFRRASWHMDFIYQLGGITTAQDHITVQFRNAEGTIEFSPAALHVEDRVALKEPIFADDFWNDLTSAYADEVVALGELGCTYLQFDDTSLAYLNDPKQRAHIAELGGDAEHQHETYIRHINEALEKRPEGMTITTHMCRGNFRSSWVAEGGYDFVAEALFNQLEVDGFFMEWDDARSGGFEPLRFVPAGKLVVLGLVTTKKGDLESKDLLKRRIEEASQFVDVEQLCLSPQCGFSSTVEGNELSEDQQWAKLRRIVEVAEEGWG